MVTGPKKGPSPFTEGDAPGPRTGRYTAKEHEPEAQYFGQSTYQSERQVRQSRDTGRGEIWPPWVRVVTFPHFCVGRKAASVKIIVCSGAGLNLNEIPISLVPAAYNYLDTSSGFWCAYIRRSFVVTVVVAHLSSASDLPTYRAI